MNTLAQIDSTIPFEIEKQPSSNDPTANPFRLVVDPVMRTRLRRALYDLIENHDQQLAQYVSEDKLDLESYKEYVELFARSLKETMNSVEGVAYLLDSCGFQVGPEQINLNPETRWKRKNNSDREPSRL